MHEEWGGEVQFLDVITRQAHPGPEVQGYETFDQKKLDAEKFSREDNYTYPVLIDDLAGSTHQVYGGLADPTYIIDADGRVAFYCLWTHAPTLHTALEELTEQDGRGVVMGGIHRRPHLLATIADGWRGLRRGLPQSFIELELSAPGMASVPWLGHFVKPLLAPIALRSRPLPASAKIGLAIGAAALIGIVAGALISRKGDTDSNGEYR
ncbi:MAG: hypothetical protein WKF92_15075 [Pyrinomonadaceae bacterium]